MGRASPTPSKETNPQMRAAEAEKQVLSAAMLSVFKDEWSVNCFLSLGEQSLPFEKRTKSFCEFKRLDKPLQAEASV
jgi:hypothetical protein